LPQYDKEKYKEMTVDAAKIVELFKDLKGDKGFKLKLTQMK
jgi:hypothetical protein